MAPIATSDEARHGNAPVGEDDLMIVDDLLIALGADKNQIPLLCFPRSERGTVDYDQFDGRDIDRMVDHAAKHYMSCGLKPVGHHSYYLACN